MDLALATIRDFSPLVLGAGGISGLLLAVEYRRRTVRTVRRTLKLISTVAVSAIAIAAAITIAIMLFS